MSRRWHRQHIGTPTRARDVIEIRMRPMATYHQISDLLGVDASKLLDYKARGFSSDKLHLPGPDFVDRVIAASDRSRSVQRNFNAILNHGCLAGTGYVSILPVDQGIEHSAGASRLDAPEPQGTFSPTHRAA